MTQKIALKEMVKSRIDLDLTREALADACGVSREAIAKLERDGHGSLDLKERVAVRLGRPFRHLFPQDATKLQRLLDVGGENDVAPREFSQGAPEPDNHPTE